MTAGKRRDFNEILWKFTPLSGVTRALVENVVRLEYGDIPSRIIDLGKAALLDAIGCMLAGSIQDSSRKVLRFARHQGGAPECTVACYGDRTNRYQAALVNGAFCHGWDYDDAMGVGMSCASAVVPAALAVAEKELREGHRLITAVVLGYETMCRIGAAAAWVPIRIPLDPISTFGPFGAAVAAGKLMGFREFDLENAISLCAAQAAGTLQAVKGGGEVARLHGGFAGAYGVRCCYLAKEGLSGPRETLEGNMGFFQCVCGLDDHNAPRFDVGKVNEAFGEKWLMEGITFKRYPVGNALLGLAEAVAALRDENKFTPEEVAEVVVGPNASVGSSTLSASAAPEPDDMFRAQHSVAWTVGMAIVAGGNGLNLYRRTVPPRDKSARIAAFLPKVKMAAEAPGSVEHPFCRQVTIQLKGGKVISTNAGWPKGNYLHNPMSPEELEGKFRDQAGIAGFSGEKQERVLRMVNNLEHLDNVGELMRELVR